MKFEFVADQSTINYQSRRRKPHANTAHTDFRVSNIAMRSIPGRCSYPIGNILHVNILGVYPQLPSRVIVFVRIVGGFTGNRFNIIYFRKKKKKKFAADRTTIVILCVAVYSLSACKRFASHRRPPRVYAYYCVATAAGV